MDATLHLTKRREDHHDTRNETQFLESLDQGAASFLQQGRLDKALDYLEEALRQRQLQLGLSSPEVLAYAGGIARKIIPLACALIEKGDSYGAAQLLHRVEAVLPVDLPSEMCDLMSALSCVYRKQAKQTLARQYALRALAVVNGHPTLSMDRTNAYLTMCAALSSLGDHTEALAYALRAVQCAQEELVEASLGKSTEASRKMPVLAVAYHNAGVEAEYIVKYEIAMEWYQKALRFVRQHREECPKLRDLEKTYQTAATALDRKMKEAAPFIHVAGNRPPIIPKFRSPVRTEAALSDRSGVRRKGNRPATAGNRFLSPKLPSERTKKVSKVRLAFSRQPSPKLSNKFPYSPAETSLERLLPPSSPRSLAQVYTEGDLDVHEIPSQLEYSAETNPREMAERKPPLRFKTLPHKVTNTHISYTKADLDLLQKQQEVSLRSKLEEESLSRKNSSGYEENVPSSATSSFPSSLQASFRALRVSDKQESEEERESEDLLEQLRTVVVVPKRKESRGQPSEDKSEGKTRDDEEKRKAIVKIQAKMRVFLAKLRLQRMRNAAKQRKIRILRYRTVKQFPQGLGIVQIYQQAPTKNLYLSVTGPAWPTELPSLSLPEGQDVPFLTERLVIKEGKVGIRVVAEGTAAVVKIQALLRGVVARRRVSVLRNSHRKGRKVIFRSCQRLNEKFLTLSLVKSGEDLAVVQDTEELAKPIPELLRSLPPSELLDQIRLRGDSLDFPSSDQKPEVPKAEIGNSLLSLTFGSIGKRKGPRPITTELPPPSENPASPSSVPSITHSDVEEPLKPTERPIEFVSDTGSDYQAVESAGESTETVGNSGESTMIRQEIATSKGVFLVSILKLESGLIQVSAEPILSSDPEPEKTAYDEDILRAEFECAETFQSLASVLLSDFAIVDNKAVLSRLSPTFPLHPLPSDEVSVPRIVICESSSPLLSGQTATRREYASPQQLHMCAIRIQCAWRRYLAKGQFLLRKGIGKSAKAGKVLSCYRLFLGNAAFSVQIYERNEGVTINAVNISKQMEHTLDLVLGKDYFTLNYEEISRRMWTKGASLGVFLQDNMTPKHHQAATTIAKVAKGRISRKAVLTVKKNSTRQIQACRVKEFDGIRLGLMAFLIGSKMQIECFPLFKSTKGKAKSRFAFFSMRELSSLYPSPLSPLFVLDDVSFEEDQITLQSLVSKIQTRQKTCLSLKTAQETRSIIRTSRRLDEKMWVVTMGIIGVSEDLLRPNEDDIVEFAAFSTSQQKPLTVKTTVEELANLTKLSPGDIFPIGTLTIQKLLKVKDGALIIDHTEKVPDISSLATYLQAHVRGFITRRKMQYRKSTKSTLITCMTVSLEGAQWVMYAYREPPFIKMEAVHRIHKTTLSTLISDNIFSKFPPTLTKKRIIDNFIIPKLHIVAEEGARHLRATKSMQLQQSLYEKHQGKIKVLTQNVANTADSVGKDTAALRGRKGFGPLSALIMKAGFEDEPCRASPVKIPEESTQKIVESESESDDSSNDGSLSPVPRLAVPVEDNRDSSSLILSFMGDDPGKLPKSPPEEEKKSPETLFVGRKELRKETKTEPLQVKFLQKAIKPLLLRSGYEQDGSYYLVSMFGDKKTVLVEFQDQHTNEKAAKEIDISAETVDNLELYCTQLLNRMTLTRASHGHLAISLTDQTSHVLSVLYKKSHYVSNRYCIVTVNETSAGLIVTCYDPERQQTLNMTLGPRRQRNADSLQKDLADLVKRLRIGEVMGESTLTLALG